MDGYLILYASSRVSCTAHLNASIIHIYVLVFLRHVREPCSNAAMMYSSSESDTGPHANQTTTVRERAEKLVSHIKETRCKKEKKEYILVSYMQHRPRFITWLHLRRPQAWRAYRVMLPSGQVWPLLMQ